VLVENRLVFAIISQLTGDESLMGKNCLCHVEPTPAAFARDFSLLRERAPLVHCLGNSVGRPLMANALLALGASPAMVSAASEVGRFVYEADALVVNLGSLTEDGAGIIRHAAGIASKEEKPWLLDPTAIGSLPLRTGLAHELLALHPGVVKGNASEILSLAGEDGQGRCADATQPPERALEAATRLAGREGLIVVITGATDYVTNGRDCLRVEGGHPLMSRVTGTGCALGAVIGGFLGTGLEPWRAAAAGVNAFALAGARAGAAARGPGSFVSGLLDQLYLLE
jgi:hydroxyethylthiazole kinase